MNPMLKSFISAFFTTVLTNPMWVLQSKMTLDKDQFGFIKKIKQIIEKDGIMTF